MAQVRVHSSSCQSPVCGGPARRAAGLVEYNSDICQQGPLLSLAIWTQWRRVMGVQRSPQTEVTATPSARICHPPARRARRPRSQFLVLLGPLWLGMIGSLSPSKSRLVLRAVRVVWIGALCRLNPSLWQSRSASHQVTWFSGGI